MPIRTHIIIATLWIGVIGAWVWSWGIQRRGELFDKPGWSVLQGMDDPLSPSSRIVLVRRDKFAALGFRGVGQPTVRTYGPQAHWSWLLLNEHHADGEIKQMPKFRTYDFPCADLRQVQQAVRDADAYAVRYLRSICT